MPISPFRRAAALALVALGAAPASGQTVSRLTGDYVCAYGCRLTDANPSIEVKNGEADCMNEYGGLFRGRLVGEDSVACFRKIGSLSPDGETLTWSDGVVWRRHGGGGR
jgi:hypothetical protein